MIYVSHDVRSPQCSPPVKQSPHSERENNQKGCTQLPSCPWQRDREVTMLTKKWLALWGNGKKIGQNYFFSFPTTLSPSQTSKPHSLFFHFYVRKNSWGSWDFNNKLIMMKNKTEKLCRLGSECLSISRLSNHFCSRSWTKIFMGSVISLFRSKDTAITVLLFPCLHHYSLRSQYSGTTKMKTKFIQSLLNLKEWSLM